MKNTLFIVFLSIIINLNAQEGFIIKNVKVFDGEKVIEQTSVKVIGDKIVEVSPDINDPNVKVIDGKAKTLIPALSNAHVHAWSPQSLKEAASFGILNFMDMHGMENYQQFMLNVKDSTNYARFYRAGYAATAPNGHGTQFGFDIPTLEKPEDARQFIAGRLKANVDYIKIIVEPYKATLSHEIVAALISEAHNENLKAVVHVSRLEDAKKVIYNKADGLVHIWWDNPISLEELKNLQVQHDFFIIPTLLTTLKAFQAMGDNSSKFLSKVELLAEINKLHKADVKILAGTDPPNLGINYTTDLHEELFLLKEAGLSNIEVLKAGTINITRAFGIKNTGLLKKGHIADMILINGDPTENIEDVKLINMIWKDGKLLKN